MEFKWDLFFKYLPKIFLASGVTFEVVLLSMLFSTILGLVIAGMRLSKSKPIRWIGRIYVDIIRGIPLLVQVLWLFFGIPMFFGKNLQPIPAGILSLTLWGTAYFGEIFRGGINSIAKEQYLAAYATGMKPFQCFVRVILPQAFRKVVPPFISQLIVMVKSSSVLSVINVQEITKRADALSAALYSPFEMYLGCAVVYFVILFIIARLGKLAEKKLRANTLEV